MLEAGVEIYEYQPTMYHCKVMIVDDRWVSIGSSNLDNRSFRLNDEANLNVLSERFATEQTRMFDEDLAHGATNHARDVAAAPVSRALDGRACRLARPVALIVVTCCAAYFGVVPTKHALGIGALSFSTIFSSTS